MRKSNILPQIGLAVVTMLLLFRGVNRSEEPLRGAPRVRSRAGLFLVLGAQIGAFALLAVSTASIFEKHLAGVAHPLLALAVWAALALSTALLGVLLFLPPRALLEAVSDRAGMLLGGAF